MPQYKTEKITNLTTGKPFVFEVPAPTLARMEEQKQLVSSGRAPALVSLGALVTKWEFTFFPAYRELLKIFMDNGYTKELITQILGEFGVSEAFIEKLIADGDFVAKVYPWFEGITSDGDRASYTLQVIYELTKEHFSV